MTGSSKSPLTRAVVVVVQFAVAVADAVGVGDADADPDGEPVAEVDAVGDAVGLPVAARTDACERAGTTRDPAAAKAKADTPTTMARMRPRVGDATIR
jgi:hypothetical protein